MSKALETDDALVACYGCSPRAAGNSDTALDHVTAQLHAAGVVSKRMFLRDHACLPCTGCGACAKTGGRCALAAKDDAHALLEPLRTAQAEVFAAPIYFYHLPAGFKALIDRSQAYYERARQDDPTMTSLPMRPAFVALVAGRPVGERLFEGALLTLRYFLEPFNLELAEPLTIRGVDGPGDLAGDPWAVEAAQEYGKTVAKALLGDKAP